MTMKTKTKNQFDLEANLLEMHLTKLRSNVPVIESGKIVYDRWEDKYMINLNFVGYDIAYQIIGKDYKSAIDGMKDFESKYKTFKKDYYEV